MSLIGNYRMSMNVFQRLRIYAGKYRLSESREFTEAEIQSVSSARVVNSEYGASVCFHMKSGGQTFIPLSTEASAGVGDVIDLSKAKLITLERDGSPDIIRVDA